MVLESDVNVVTRKFFYQILILGEYFTPNVALFLQIEWSKKDQNRELFPEEENNRTRTDTPTSLDMHDMGLATIINPLNKDATGKPLSASMKSTIERLRTWDNRS